MKRIRYWGKCPKCGSSVWEKSVDVGLTIISDEHGNKKRRIDHLGGMPWFFRCSSCGFEENEDGTGA